MSYILEALRKAEAERSRGAGVSLMGHRKPKSRGPLIYASNHQSLFDPALVGILIRDRPYAAMARKSLFDFGPFALLIRFFKAIPVRRGESDPEEGGEFGG